MCPMYTYKKKRAMLSYKTPDELFDYELDKIYTS